MSRRINIVGKSCESTYANIARFGIKPHMLHVFGSTFKFICLTLSLYVGEDNVYGYIDI